MSQSAALIPREKKADLQHSVEFNRTISGLWISARAAGIYMHQQAFVAGGVAAAQELEPIIS